ncbi:MAG: hypothetical protein H6747_01020 [Deltaproteobacteria bacterium]|nr:hypothetical protein [Deltaproteobacteria bacterium]
MSGQRRWKAAAGALVLCAWAGACSEDASPVRDAGQIGDGAAADVADVLIEAGTLGPGCIGKADGTPCDDGDPCTDETRCTAGSCGGGLLRCACNVDTDCAPYEDGDRCNGTLICSALRTCVVDPSTIVHCDPSTATVCSSPTCEPLSGQCVPLARPNGTPCAGEPCWPLAACADGVCSNVTGGTKCPCQTDGDCAAQEDGNLCNGTLYCDTSIFPGSCKVNPVTVVTCAEPPVGGCQATVCAPASGDCVTSALADGTVCDDGDATTAVDLCLAGSCVGTAYGACASDSDCAAQEDGDLCNGTLYCDVAAQACAINPITVVKCPSVADTACTHNTCTPSTGTCALTPLADGTACDDGDACTVGEVCAGGSCTTGTKACLCKSDADCASKEDGNLCNGTLFCNAASGSCEINVATRKVCPTAADDDCNKAACVPLSGECTMVQVGHVATFCDLGAGTSICRTEVKPGAKDVAASCDDGEACTVGETCQGTACAGGVDVCFCSTDADCKDDGDLCNGLPFCDKSDPSKPTCAVNPATAVVCPTAGDTACKKATCQPQTGTCKPTLVADGENCDDGAPCTAGDYCVGGSCHAGLMICDCLTHADCLDSDDGDLCNGVPYCDKSDPKKPVCKPNPASAVFCDKSQDTACQQSVCDPKTGTCALAPVGAGTACDDGNACTEADGCKLGACAGTPAKCDDDDPCTIDSCDPKTGCDHGAASCDDGNVCTVDVCDPKTGACVFDAAAAVGKGCDADGDGCTVGDACHAGACKAGPQAVCPAASGACDQAVCVSTGATGYTCGVVQRPDGATCSGAGGCTVDASCQKGACVPGSIERLHVRTHTEVAAHRGVALLAGGAGGAWLTGRQPSPTDPRWRLDRVDAGGHGVSALNVALNGAVTDTGAGARDVVLDNQGLLVVGGDVGTADAGRQFALAAVSPKSGALLWQQTYGGAGDESLARMKQHPAGGWLLLGHRKAGAALDGFAVRSSPGGILVGSWQGGGLEEDGLLGGVGRTDGSSVVVGVTQAGAARRGWLVGLDGASKTVFELAVGDAADQTLSSVAVLADGDLLAAGWRQDGTLRHPWWVRTSAAGKLRWQRTLPLAAWWRDILPRASGGVVLVGAVDPSGSAADAWLCGMDAAGYVAWQRVIDAGGVEELAALRLDGAGAPVAVGQHTSAKGASAGLLVHTDAWGHASCTEAGVCAAISATTCTDAKPCTDDLCDAISGCVATPNALPCSDGDPCTGPDLCESGVCKPGGPETCDDANACTSDACKQGQGCVHTALQGACPDDTVCTEKEICQAGICVLSAVDCDDGDPCTYDTCDAVNGCKNAALADDSPCATGKVCVEGACIARWAIAIAAGSGSGASAKIGFAALQPGGTLRVWDENNGPGKPSVPPGVVAIAGGETMTYLLTDKGKVWVRGYSKYGAIGLGSSTSYQSTATPLTTLQDAKAIWAGPRAGCARLATGETRCWGQQKFGVFGDGVCSSSVSNGPYVSSPKAMPHLDSFVELALGLAMGCGRKADGTVWCWGGGKCGDTGYRGDGSGKAQPTPVQVAALTDAVQITAGFQHACALRATGGVKCWGRHSYGQLGTGTTSSKAVPAQVYGLESGVAGVVAGDLWTCAWLEDGTAACWGNNNRGQLGIGNKSNMLVPTAVKNLTGVIGLATNHLGDAEANIFDASTCALRKDGSVACWGAEALGSGATGSTIPVNIPGSLP